MSSGNQNIPQKKGIWIATALLLPFTVILILNASHYLPFISDDSLISLRYASRLLEGNGLTWNDDHPVEGYSNLLWILLVALPGLVGIDLIIATRILGILGMAAIMFSISYWYINQNAFRNIWFSLTVALLFLSIGAPMAVWSIGGLEQPLYGALIAISIPLLYSIIESERVEKKKILLLSFSLGLICITRLDGPIFTAAGVITFLLARRHYGKYQSILSSFLILLFPIVLYTGQLIFRFYYYGELLPNTALVKITPSIHHFFNGLKYLQDGLMALFPFSFLAIISIFIILTLPNKRGRGIYLLTILAMWCAYIAFIGGDIFPAYRHFIPLIVVFAFALVEGSNIVVNYLIAIPRSRYYFIYITFVIALFIPYTYIQFSNPQYLRAIDERWEWAGKELGLLLKKAFSAQQPLLAVTAAGCLPYWSELPALDMLGLNDYYLPRHPPKNIENGFIGHELGDGQYILSRKPDIIIFNIGSGPSFRSGQEMEKLAAFYKFYTPIVIKTTLEDEEHFGVVYFNKYSHKVGIKKSHSSITMPGFLFSGNNTIAYLNKTNNLVTQIKKGQAASLTFDIESQEDWLIDVKASDPRRIHSALRQSGMLLSIILFTESTEPIEIEEVVLKNKVGL